MKSVAFFSNKVGVGTTSLVHHLAWMFHDQNQRVLAVDLDPQSGLTSAFLDEKARASIWQATERATIDGSINALFDGLADGVALVPHVERVDERIGLLPSDLGLSEREDELASQWPKCLDGDPRAFQVTTAFARLVSDASEQFEADIALIDVGPNLGAISRAALIASDYVVVPLRADPLSLQAVRCLGRALESWRKGWQDRMARVPAGLDLDLPAGKMRPLGYIEIRPAVNLGSPVKGFAQCVEAAPLEYRKSILHETSPDSSPVTPDEHCLAMLDGYQFLMELAEEARKPMFMLKPGDRVNGSHAETLLRCHRDFNTLRQKILSRIGAADAAEA